MEMVDSYYGKRYIPERIIKNKNLKYGAKISYIIEDPDVEHQTNSIKKSREVGFPSGNMGW